MEVVAGSVVGVMVVVFANGLRRVPLSRNPWEHVIGAFVGGFGMYKASGYLESERAKHNALLAQYTAREAALSERT